MKRSAGVMLLREDRGEILLLALAGRNSWDLPKGGIRKDETPFLAAQRELLEETGISDVTWVKAEPFSINYALRNKVDKEVTFFMAITKKSKVTVSSEHLSYRWITVPSAELYLPERFHPAISWVKSSL